LAIAEAESLANRHQPVISSVSGSQSGGENRSASQRLASLLAEAAKASEKRRQWQLSSAMASRNQLMKISGVASESRRQNASGSGGGIAMVAKAGSSWQQAALPAAAHRQSARRWLA
jgi:hypothetical protein